MSQNPNNEPYCGAPYNFVALPDRARAYIGSKSAVPLPDAASYASDRLSGHFLCTLTTLTPLYIRNVMTRNEYTEQQILKQKTYETALPTFFGPHGQTRLPGSSLRGMIRNLVEILGEGQFQTPSDTALFYRAVADRKASSLTAHYDQEIRAGGKLLVRAGFMVKKEGGIYEIRTAAALNGHSFFQVETAKAQLAVAQVKQNRRFPDQSQWGRGPVWFKLPLANSNRTTPLVTEIRRRRDDQPAPDNSGDWKKGWVVISGYIPKKRHSWIILDEPGQQEPAPLGVQLEDLLAYRDDGGLSATLADEKVDFSVLPKVTGITKKLPCFFIERKNGNRTQLIFGHTPYFRLPYNKGSKDLVKEQLPQLTDGVLDLAQAVFGKAADRNGSGSGAAGRVFFEDALPQKAVEWEDAQAVIPQILSTPKPTTYQHYLDQSAANLKSSQEPINALKFWDSPGAKIRGYKLYWHRKPEQGLEWKTSEQEVKDNKAEKQHTRIKPLAAQNVFAFKVRFENLTEVELGILATALQLPSGYAHKLGMGKPLGLGSVRVETQLFLVDRRRRYQSLFEYSEDHKNVTGWQSGQSACPVDMSLYQNRFAQWLLSKPAAISDLWRTHPRLQELGAMLDYQTAPAPSKTRYMKITPLNEYKERPILPDPFAVKGLPKPVKVVASYDPVAEAEGDDQTEASHEELSKLLKMYKKKR